MYFFFFFLSFFDPIIFLTVRWGSKEEIKNPHGQTVDPDQLRAQPDLGLYCLRIPVCLRIKDSKN